MSRVHFLMVHYNNTNYNYEIQRKEKKYMIFSDNICKTSNTNSKQVRLKEVIHLMTVTSIRAGGKKCFSLS